MAKLIYLWLGCFCMEIAIAQSAGYIGRHTAIKLDANASPILFGEERAGKGYINERLGIEIEQAIGEHLSFGGGIHQLATKVNLPQAVGLVRGSSISVGVRYYVNPIAPLGFYQSTSIYWIQYQVNREEPTPPSPDLLAKDRKIALGLGVGMQRVLYKHLSVHYGIQTAWVVGEAQSSNSELLVIKKEALQRLRGYMSINLNAGIGWLLF